MACNCNGGSKPAERKSYTVDLAGAGKSFPDGSTRKVYSTAAEANVVIAQLQLTGKVRPVQGPAA